MRNSHCTNIELLLDGFNGGVEPETSCINLRSKWEAGKWTFGTEKFGSDIKERGRGVARDCEGIKRSRESC